MTQDMKRLLMMGLNYSKHYEFRHNKETNVATLFLWLDERHSLAITTAPDLSSKNNVMVRYFEHTDRWHHPSPKAGMLDKTVGKKYRKSGSHYSIVPMDEIFSIVQDLEMYASKKSYTSKYYCTPEEFI